MTPQRAGSDGVETLHVFPLLRRDGGCGSLLDALLHAVRVHTRIERASAHELALHRALDRAGLVALDRAGLAALTPRRSIASFLRKHAKAGIHLEPAASLSREDSFQKPASFACRTARISTVWSSW